MKLFFLLKIVITLADFNCFGTIPLFKEMLISFVMTGSIVGKSNLIILLDNT